MRDPDKPLQTRVEPVADWLQQVEFRKPAAPPRSSPVWRDRRLWRWIAALLVMLALGLVVFRQPLANLVWPDMRVQRLLDEANEALAQGRLSATDGTGARQRFEAAQALDSDRSEPQQGLAQVAQAALVQAAAQVRSDQFEAARQSLAMARELQVPRAQADQIAEMLRLRESPQSGLESLLRQADVARSRDDMQAALSLYQRVLTLQPNHTRALEAREDLLSDQLQQARKALSRGDMAMAGRLVARARTYDAGHAELPDLQAELARQVEKSRRQADMDLQGKRLEKALAGYQRVLQASIDDPGARQGIERVAAAYAQRSAREAADFDFDKAALSLTAARELTPRANVVKEAAQALQRARQSQSRLGASPPTRARSLRVKQLLEAMEQAESRADWLTPPGESAYDRLRAAQALAPDDPSVRRAALRLLPAVRTCFENELHANRIRRARSCYDAWQTLQPRDIALVSARQRLAMKWMAVGDERLGSGDIEFATQALREARQLDPDVSGLTEFSQRVSSAKAGGG